MRHVHVLVSTLATVKKSDKDMRHAMSGKAEYLQSIGRNLALHKNRWEI